MKNRWIATAALATVLLTGCGSSGDEKPAEEFPAAAPAPTPTAMATDVPSTGDVAMFGDTSELSAGISTSVTAAGFRTIGKDEVAVFEIRVDNTAGEQIEEGAVEATVTHGPERTALEAVKDEANGVGESFGAILPGESKSALVGVKATEPQSTSMRVEVTGPAGGDPAVFIGPFPGGEQ